MLTPLVIISTKKNNVVTERERMRLDTLEQVCSLTPDAMLRYGAEDPDELVIRILRPTREA